MYPIGAPAFYPSRRAHTFGYSPEDGAVIPSG
ncbi:hypothetical protein MES5069_90031 [Mesorhizobium escarrei]|uniref:Uncharacterized protein n=1 Tax=Mesorhizobium escarrei TaxID=666018 RepID=A0ABM9EJH2_9HYPH|nr:hypothetical protein MES5069_90031 [Mesorhizobium escarrei]